MLNTVLVEIPQQFLWAFVRTAPYLLLGLLAAGALRVLLPDELLLRLLGRGRARGVVVASLFGIPLPICSCGVVPVSLTMRRKGAGRGATMSFLVSTPETGVDSIALTFGLMGPVMAIFRPIVALVTALVGGLILEAADDEAGGELDENLGEEPEPCTCEDGCDESPPPPAEGRLQAIVRYGFGELLAELSTWLLLGLLLTAIVGALLPDDFLAGRALGAGLPAMLLMIAVGLPLYMCASSSTPLGAAFVAKGLSPGAALVFLLVGPATNLATITMVRRFYGDRFIRVYVGTVIVVSLVAGLALEWLLVATGWQVFGLVGTDEAAPFGLFDIGCALLLAGLIVIGYRRTGLRGPLREVADSSAALALLVWRVRRWERPQRRLVGILAAIVALLWLISAFTVIRPGEVGVARRFGAPTDTTLAPGLHLRFPWPVETVDTCAVDHVRVIELGFRTHDGLRLRDPVVARELDLITGDENLVDLTAVAEYRVADPYAFLYVVADPDPLVQQAVVGALDEVVLANRIDDLLTVDRDPIQGAALAATQRRLDAYGAGIEVTALRLLDVHAPPQVHDAFREVASAMEDAETAVNRARGEHDRLLAEARADAAQQVADAEVDSRLLVARARGEARAFAEFSAAERSHPVATRERLYLEALERALAGRRKVIRPGSGEFELWLVPPGETGDDGNTIEVPVIPQRAGDPTSATVDLDQGYPGGTR